MGRKRETVSRDSSSEESFFFALFCFHLTYLKSWHIWVKWHLESWHCVHSEISLSFCVSVSGLLLFKIAFRFNEDLPSHGITNALLYTWSVSLGSYQNLEWWKTGRPGFWGAQPPLVNFQATSCHPPGSLQFLGLSGAAKFPSPSVSHDKDVCDSLTYLCS